MTESAVTANSATYDNNTKTCIISSYSNLIAHVTIYVVSLIFLRFGIMGTMVTSY
jgi:hypothetical protein